MGTGTGARTGRERGRGRACRPVDEHRMGTGTGVGTGAGTVAEMGTGTRMGRWRFSFVLQQALSFRTRHHLCRQGVALAGTPQHRSRGPVSVHAHRTEGITGSEGQE